MNRTTWTVAWRHARRLLGKQRREHGEAELLDMAQRELAGQRLGLSAQCEALRCWTSRKYGPEVASFARARTRRFYALADLCRERWEREECEAAREASPIYGARVTTTGA